MRVAPTMMRRHGSIEPTGRGVSISALHEAYRGGRTIFPSRVYAPDEVARVLKTGHQSRKIGAIVTKGKRAGWPVFTLTLEERASCPRTCRAWGMCYGNAMQAAERIEHGDALEAALLDEVRALAARHPAGFMIRLHVLGDFYSENYVRLWRMMLGLYPGLHVFGFTAHAPESPIGEAVQSVIDKHGWARFAVRFSGALGAHGAARVVDTGETDPEAILCPAQTGAADCCASCALCWHSTRSISFARH
jgi:hypothetical protein